MYVGLILLVIAAILVLFGVGQRVLDRMRLTDRQALVWMALILIGGFVPNIAIGSRFAMNIGGFLIPLALCVWLFAKADTAGEKGRAVLAAVLGGVIVWGIGVWFPNEPETMPFDVNYLYGIGVGVLACFLGRSRRAAFVGGAMGIILADVIQAVVNWVNGIDQTLVLGGAGAFDAIIISAFSAVLLRELVGETHERMTRETGEPERTFEDGEIRQAEARRQSGDVEPAVLGAHRDDEVSDEMDHIPPEELPEDAKLYGNRVGGDDDEE